MIVRTKLSRPPLPPDLVPRDRLVELLEAKPDRSLTLVSAPAGYGKSTLVSRWLGSMDRAWVWLSLDEEDDELRVFLRYFVAAVRMHSPKACRRTHDLLDAAELPPNSVLGDYLLNDLQAIKRPFVLVVDDYHRVRAPVVHDLIDHLLRRPVRSFHLVLVTRYDPPLPLATLRARGRTLEVRAHDLRFTREETQLVIRKLGGVTIGPDTLAHLHSELEGWIVGLRLVCLSLRNREDPEGFLAGLDGGTTDVQGYLLEEVLKQLPPDFRECLLRTSILNRFCAPLCEALCLENTDTFTGEDFIRDVEQSNLFVVALDDRGTWFRFHHLFQQLLRHLLDQRLAVDEIRSLHERASRWFAAENLVDEALDHAVAAGEPDLAADIVETHRVEILNADNWPILAGWLAQLPEEVVWKRPELLLGEAWQAYYRFQIPALFPIVERIDALLADGESRPEWEGELSMFKAYLLYWQGQAGPMLTEVGKAQDLLPETHDLMRADSEIYFGLGLHLAGQKDVAISELTGRIRINLNQKGLMMTRRVITLAFVHMLAGNMGEGLVYSRQLGELARISSPVYITTWATYLMGCCYFQMGNWGEAERCFRWMVENRYVSHTAAVMSSLVGLGLTLHFQGRGEESETWEHFLRDYAMETKDPANLVLAESGCARIRLQRGHRAGGDPGYESSGMATAFVFIEVPEVTQCRRFLARGSHSDLERVLALLDQLQPAAEEIHSTFHLIDLVGLRALACRGLGRLDEAQANLDQALELAAPGNWVRPFVEAGPAMAELLQEARQNRRTAQVERILNAFSEVSVSVTAQENHSSRVETLTNRELDVLECLAERLYDKEIAVRLSISIATVKTHVKHVYGKLAVSNRREAVVQAEKLGII